MSTLETDTTEAAAVVVKPLLVSTKSLPAGYHHHRISNEKLEVNRDDETVSEWPARPRLRTRASFKFTEGLRKQGSVDFTTPRPRIFSKELPEIHVEKPRAESMGSQRINTERMPPKVGRVLRRQLTLDTIPDDSVFVENETTVRNERKTQASRSAPSTLSSTQRKVSVQQRQRKHSSKPFKTSHTNFSMVGAGRRTSISVSRKTSKAHMTRYTTIENINLPASYQSRYGIRRSTLATSLPKVSIYVAKSSKEV